MAALDTVALGAVLKQKYNKKKINSIGYQPDGPFWAALKKEGVFGGDSWKVGVKYGRPQGRSHLLSRAMADLTPSSYKAFTLTRMRDYGAFGFDNEAVLAAKGDMDSMIDAQSEEIEGAIENLTLNVCQELFRNGGAARARGSTVSTTVLTLTQPADCAQFENGMTCVSSTTDGGSTAPVIKAGSVQIVGIDRDAGTVTANVAWSTGIPTFAQTDYIFQDGDGGLGIKGLLAWLPTTAPSAGDNFFGADRSSDSRLSGVRIAGLGGPIEETFIEAQARLARERSKADTCLMNPLDWAQFAKAISGKSFYSKGTRSSEDAVVGWDTIQCTGPTGKMDIMADVSCPKGTAFMLQMNTWVFKYLGDGAPHIMDTDGRVFIRDPAGSDGHRGYCVVYGQLGCEAPGWNAVITL